jgi:DNA-binding NarL/FixJ family response regulator
MHDALRARLEGVPTPTPLQIAILRAKVAGKTDRSIARAFKLGERTVRRQIEDLIAVLGVSCRAELYAEAVRYGWLDREPG